MSELAKNVGKFGVLLIYFVLVGLLLPHLSGLLAAGTSVAVVFVGAILMAWVFNKF